MDRSTYSTENSYGNFQEDSTNHPGFAKLRSDGGRLPTSSYYWYRIDASKKDDLAELADVGMLGGILLGNGIFQNRFGGKTANIGTLDKYHNIVSNKTLAKVRNSSVNLGVALGEYRETAKFVVDAMKRTRAIYDVFKKDLRKFKFGDALHDLGKAVSHGHTHAANAWLEWTYAVKPLISDTAGVVKELYSDQRPYLEVKTVRASVSQNVTAQAFKAQGGDSLRNRLTGACKTRGCIRYVVANPLLATADQLGLLNPVAIGWELIPLSFVVDWFVDISGLLTNVIPPMGVDFQEGYTSVHARGETRVTQVLHFSDRDLTVSCGSVETLKNRRAMTTFPRYNLDRPDISLSKSQLTSATALLVQHLLG